ncbi:hypothetical protein [Pseudonocardia alni]|uniref:hypothetical protein n=1 Tax=Pseudonocardia alni TaxID=33907 RepID=UPI00279ABEAB|nr:hypothetical protein PaSha_28690 [Pseudonocardia alni]
MTAPSLPISEPMADFAGGPDLVLQCRCGAPMQPAEMRRLPTALGTAPSSGSAAPTATAPRPPSSPA